MLKHIVMWKLKDSAKGNTKEKNIQLIKESLEKLPSQISEIKKYEIGVNKIKSSVSYDMVLYSEFLDENDLNKYRVHPEHMKIVDFIKEIIEKTVCIDY